MFIIPTLFKKKKNEGDIAIAFVRPSVSPLCYLLRQNLAKFGVWVTHMNGACNGSYFFAPPPGALGRGQKVKYHLFDFNYRVNFKDFYTKLCVCSHKWKIQNILDGIFILSPGWCPRGGTSECWGCPGGQKKFFQTCSCGISNWRGWGAEQNASKVSS